MLETQEKTDVINTSSDDSSSANLSQEETQQIAHRSSGIEPEPENNEELPLVEDQDVLVSERKLVSEENPLFRIFAALVITGALAIAVLFMWSAWGKITGENNISQDQQQKNLAVNPKPQVNPEDEMRAELALINQNSDLQPSPQPSPSPVPEPKPKPTSRSKPTSRPTPPRRPEPKPEKINPLDQWAALSQLGATTGDSLTAQSNLQDLQEISLVPTSQQSSSSSASDSNESVDSPRTLTRERLTENENLNNRINQGEVAQIASVSIGSGTLNQTQREFQDLSPQAKDIVSENHDNSYLLSKQKQFQQQDDTIASQINHLSNLGVASSFTSTTDENTTNSLQENSISRAKTLSPQPKSSPLPSYQTVSNIPPSEDISESPTNNQIDDYLYPNTEKNVPLGTVASGELSTTVVWSDNLDPNKTRATINLSEPLLADDGSVALKANSSIICEVESIAPDGLTILNAIAISYEDSQGRLQQQPLPKDAILIRGEKDEPLIAQTESDPGGTILGQDVLTGLLGAGERGFELLNEPSARTVVSDDGFFRSSVTRDDPSFINGAAEGIFSSTKDSLDDRSKEIINRAVNRDKIFEVEAGTPISVYVNSFLQINY